MSDFFNTTADLFHAETTFCMRVIRELGAARRAGDEVGIAEWSEDAFRLAEHASSPSVRARAAREMAAATPA